MKTKFTLKRNERLKSRKLIESVFVTGKKIHQPPFRVHYLLTRAAEKQSSGLQVGVGVSSKYFKKAVDRNRLKRLVREAWRLEKNDLKESVSNGNQLLVFLIYTGKEMINYAQVLEPVKKIIKKLLNIVKE